LRKTPDLDAERKLKEVLLYGGMLYAGIITVEDNKKRGTVPAGTVPRIVSYIYLVNLF
jgi:hypothetical protein